MNRPLKVFISGALSAPDERRRMANVDAANEAAAKVVEAGHYPFVPHNMVAVHAEVNKKKQPTEEWWLEWCLTWLCDCDVVLRLGASPGADVEQRYALARGIPVVEHVKELEGIA
jgi:nucleoside 2-deoxyribosyltransferase